MARKRATRLPTQGKRTGVTVDGGAESSQIESIENFFDQAKSPEEKKDDDASSKVQGNARGRPKRVAKEPERKAEPKIRLSLPGQDLADDASTTSIVSSTDDKKEKPQPNRKVLGMPSPSELSKVSTMPPTPGTSLNDQLLTQEEVDVPRYAANEEDVQERPVPIQDKHEVDDFPTQDDDTNSENDGDDLAPPVMEEEDIDQQSPLPAPQLAEDSENLKPPASVALPENNLSDTDSDHDEGPGFNMVHDPETPQGAQEEKSLKSRGRKKKSLKTRGSMESDDKTQRKSKNKSKRRVVFSPKGIPIGNRDYDRIPIVEPSPNDGDGLRRSKRAKTAPLEFWRNEKVEYGPIEDDELVEEIGDMPVPKAVIRALDTPYRKRKEPAKPKVSSKSKSKGKQRTARDQEVEEEQPFDTSKLKRKYKNNLLEGETANVWDDGNDDLNELSKSRVEFIGNRTSMRNLPLFVCFCRGRGVCRSNGGR